MKKAPSTSRSIEGLFVDTPVLVAARRVLKQRLGLVAKLLAFESSPEENPDWIRRLRVATRRASAALEAFQLLFDQPVYRKCRKVLREIRRTASSARQAEVLLERLEKGEAGGPLQSQVLPPDLLVELQRERSESRQRLVSACGERLGRRFAKGRKHLTQSMLSVRAPRRCAATVVTDVVPYTLGELAALELPPLFAGVRGPADTSRTTLEDLHERRVANKKLRYACEIFGGCFPEPERNEVFAGLEETQNRLGEINDLHEIAFAVEQYALRGPATESAVVPAARESSQKLAAAYHVLCDQRVQEFQPWWTCPKTREMYTSLSSLIQRHCMDWASKVRSRRQPGPGAAQRDEAIATPSKAVDSVAGAAWHRRVAAIDVGSNSIRLTVAETDPENRFRIIEDLKESTRLGSGVYVDGKLKAGAIERSLVALERMRSVAESHHVDRIRTVGTSALREATNSREFLDAARRRAGVHVEVIDGDREARLAFSSVASAFDLPDLPVAVADLGGGSMELILGSGGIVDAVFPLPLGAVRLTERFLTGADPNEGYERMIAEIDRVLSRVVRRRSRRPDSLIGTGGTFTSLARVSILRGMSTNGGGRFPFAVRGFEIPRKLVSETLDWLRGLSPEERRNVAGLSQQRAEIIVAGVCVVDHTLRHLGATTLRIHDGGIRDGLLAEMIDDLSFDPRSAPTNNDDLVRVAREFAERSEYEKSHSEHVAMLALQILDQLAEQVPDASGTWARSECRALLLAAGVLHDVGMRVAWAQHHKHGYDLIVHGDLPGLSRREIEILASAARYHRRGGPRARHPNFRKLADDDQRLVRHLVGILRIADGLDRLHTQNVVGVQVRAVPGFVHFGVEADDVPMLNIAAAEKKADVFESAFHVRTEFTWVNAGESARLERTTA